MRVCVYIFVHIYVACVCVRAMVNEHIQVHQEHLMDDAAEARRAAEDVVAAAHGEPVAVPDMVQLDISDTSPMVR